jgi:hypothetical protein
VFPKNTLSLNSSFFPNCLKHVQLDEVRLIENTDEVSWKRKEAAVNVFSHKLSKLTLAFRVQASLVRTTFIVTSASQGTEPSKASLASWTLCMCQARCHAHVGNASLSHSTIVV